jgi:TRAP-type C4-dicarboxylate transport system permease small subunit
MVPEPGDGTTQYEYLSYMLRLWQESVDEPVEVDGAPVWRASLTSPMTGERLGFATLDDLVEYLRHQVNASARTDVEESRKRR